VKKLLTAMERTGQQIFDRRFLKVFFFGLLTTIGAILISYIIADQLMDKVPLYSSDWQWWEDLVNDMTGFLFSTAFIFLIFMFFAPISTIFVSIFLDDIIDCVEERFYPDFKAGKRLGVSHLAFLAMRLLFFIVLLNILALPFYVLLFWIPIIPLAIFYILNGYLLGWGYYEMVAVRHLGIKEAGVHRKSIRGVILMAGLVMTFLFMIPIVQFTVPILGVAMMCHLFHLSRYDYI
jgi:CysZ protein